MGDRFTYGFVDEVDGNTIFLYSHWGGSDAVDNLRKAIGFAEQRWNDVTYANRIAISQLIGEWWTDSIGYGLSVNRVLDSDHPYVLIVDFKHDNVSAYHYDVGAYASLGSKFASWRLYEFAWSHTVEDIQRTIQSGVTLYEAGRV